MSDTNRGGQSFAQTEPGNLAAGSSQTASLMKQSLLNLPPCLLLRSLILG